MLIYFWIFAFPNFAASNDLSMVTIFEPDEGVPVTYVFDMIKPFDNVKQAILNFLRYDYYFYGYPFFMFSAIAVLPVKLLGSFESHYPQTMLLLRQLLSVLPIMISVYLLVYMQGKFKNWKWSLTLLLFLLTIPAVVRNNFWWHPDSLVTLFIVLTIYFLNKDKLTFGKYFYLAALFCGYATGIKLIGVFFVLTIPVLLLWGWRSKKISFKRMVTLAFGYVGLMLIGYLIANPLFILAGPREGYINVFQRQTRLLREGYEVAYATGLGAAAPTIIEYYGNWIFLLIAFLGPIIGIIKNKNRLLHVVILTWSLPLSIYVITMGHFKFQYWLPVALPLFSSLYAYLPEKQLPRIKFNEKNIKQKVISISTITAILIIFVQTIIFVRWGIDSYFERLYRADNNPSIQFYEEAATALFPLNESQFDVYHDVRLYIPASSPWHKRAIFELLTYDYFEKTNPDIILLMQQRIYDYLNPNVEAIDPEELRISRVFYNDAEIGEIEGYLLVYRNDFGLAFVREDLYQEIINK